MPSIDDRMAFPKQEAAEVLGVSLSKLEMLIAREEIAALKSGKNVLVTREEMKRYLNSLPAAVLKDRLAAVAQRKAGAA